MSAADLKDGGLKYIEHVEDDRDVQVSIFANKLF